MSNSSLPFCLRALIRPLVSAPLCVGAALVASLALPRAVPAQSLIDFAVVGGTGISNSGATTITGLIGTYPGTALTGSGSIGIIDGSPNSVFLGDPVAQAVVAEASGLYGSMGSASCDDDLTGQDLGGMSLDAGVYCLSGAAAMSGVLQIISDFGDVVIRITGDLNFSGSLGISPLSGALVYWLVDGSATISPSSVFYGILLAQQGVTLGAGATMNCGTILSFTGTVAMNGNSLNSCSEIDPPNEGTKPGTKTYAMRPQEEGGEFDPDIGEYITTVPEPSTLAMILPGLAALGGIARHRRLQLPRRNSNTA